VEDENREFPISEHVDNLGADSIPSETGLLIPSVYSRKAFFPNRRLHNLFLLAHSPRVSRSEVTVSAGMVSCPNACHTSEPVRIPTMYDGELTPLLYWTSVLISFL
jgi:hypothetical protein